MDRGIENKELSRLAYAARCTERGGTPGETEGGRRERFTDTERERNEREREREAGSTADARRGRGED